MIDGFVIGVSSSIAGGFLVIMIQYFWRYKSEKRAPFTGLWEDHIVDPNTGIVKIDQIHMRQRGEIINGDIVRLEPNAHTHRKWKFAGRVIGNNFFAVFWPIDRSIPSFGCWYLHLKSDYTFEGFYLKLDEESDGKIHKIPITIKRTDRII